MFMILLRKQISCLIHILFFFFNDTATTEIYTLSLHDALPICTGLLKPRLSVSASRSATVASSPSRLIVGSPIWRNTDRKSTRLNSSHLVISYAVFCLKKKKNL